MLALHFYHQGAALNMFAFLAHRYLRAFFGFLFLFSCIVAMRSQILWSLLPFTRPLTRPDPTIEAYSPVLRFTNRGTFQISIFEDLHYGEAEDLDWGPEQDINSEKVMNSVLATERPQLAVLNGDLITGENTFLENSTHYLDAIVRPLIQHRLPWASTYGNHDIQVNLSTESLLQREQRYTLSLTQKMVNNPNAGVSNYYLPVYSSNLHKNAPELLLWFFDSRGGKEYQKLNPDGSEISVPSYVHESVVNWFIQTNQMIVKKYSKPIPSLGFVHIPIDAMGAFQDAGVDSNKQPGLNDDVPLDHQGVVCRKNSTGSNNCQYVGQDIPFMSALLSTPKFIGLFSGHDHGNDWCFKWNSSLHIPNTTVHGNGFNVCFGRHTGYGGYGSWTRGSRQIFIQEEDLDTNVSRPQVETWIRLEDGSVSGVVMLNQSYGTDQYPTVHR